MCAVLFKSQRYKCRFYDYEYITHKSDLSEAAKSDALHTFESPNKYVIFFVLKHMTQKSVLTTLIAKIRFKN